MYAVAWLVWHFAVGGTTKRAGSYTAKIRQDSFEEVEEHNGR
jgi:hypothetical protein